MRALTVSLSVTAAIVLGIAGGVWLSLVPRMTAVFHDLGTRVSGSAADVIRAQRCGIGYLCIAAAVWCLLQERVVRAPQARQITACAGIVLGVLLSAVPVVVLFDLLTHVSMARDL